MGIPRSSISFFVFLCVALNSWDVVSSTATCQTTYNNLDIMDNNLNTTLGASSSCCQYCQEQSGCLAWTWTSYQGGTCWLKNDTQPLWVNPGAVTVMMSPNAAQTYSLAAHYNSSNFFTHFTFDSHCCGFMNATDLNTALAKGLAKTVNGSVYFGTDNTTVLAANSTIGRNSIGIKSVEIYNSGLFIYDISHVPECPGCWPAFWSHGINTSYGEIDVLESISEDNYNHMTLHTSANCAMNANDSIYFNGTWGQQNNLNTTNCYINATGFAFNTGCSISAPNGTYNTPFNQAGGGVFALEWDSQKFIRIWNFVRPNIPADILQGSPNPNPTTWGMPTSYFRFGANCSPSHFYNQSIIINTGLCGWAGNEYPGGESACESVVRSSPANYTNAYWIINSLKVYCRPGDPCLAN